MTENTAADKLNLMRVFYDLTKASISFDIVHFLAMADTNRRMQGFDGLHFILIAPSDFGDERIHWRIGNIIMPVLPMLPACKKITICSEREQVREILTTDTSPVYPENYRVDDPPSSGCEMYRLMLPAYLGAETSSISAPELALKYADDWISANSGGRKVISFTVRALDGRKEKNSNLDIWFQLAHELEADGYFPVFLKDHEDNYANPAYEGFASFPQAVANVQLRTGFYERCYLNLFSPNGPSELCWVNGGVRYILFGMINCRSEGEVERPHVLGEHGFRFGDQLPFARPYHKWVWEPDSLDLMRAETYQMLDAIEASEEEALGRGPLIPRVKLENLVDIISTFREFGNDACADFLGEFFNNDYMGKIEDDTPSAAAKSLSVQ
mgnify:FL=1|jgi:hypothetical protein